MRSLVALGEIDTPLYTLSKRKISYEGGNRQKTFLRLMRRFTDMGSAVSEILCYTHNIQRKKHHKRITAGLYDYI